MLETWNDVVQSYVGEKVGVTGPGGSYGGVYIGNNEVMFTISEQTAGEKEVKKRGDIVQVCVLEEWPNSIHIKDLKIVRRDDVKYSKIIKEVDLN